MKVLRLQDDAAELLLTVVRNAISELEFVKHRASAGNKVKRQQAINKLMEVESELESAFGGYLNTL